MNWIHLKTLDGLEHLINLDQIECFTPKIYPRGVQVTIDFSGSPEPSDVYISEDDWERIKSALKLP